MALQSDSVAISAARRRRLPDSWTRGGLPAQSHPTPCDVGAYQSDAGTTTTIVGAREPRPRFGSPVQVTVTVQHPVVGPTGSVELSGVPDGPLSASLDAGVATFSVSDLAGRRPHPHRHLRPRRSPRRQLRRPPADRSPSSTSATTARGDAVRRHLAGRRSRDPHRHRAQRDEHRGGRPDRQRRLLLRRRPSVATATLSGDTATASGRHARRRPAQPHRGLPRRRRLRDQHLDPGGPRRAVVDDDRGHRPTEADVRRGVPAERHDARPAREACPTPPAPSCSTSGPPTSRRAFTAGFATLVGRRRQHDRLHDPARR